MELAASEARPYLEAMTLQRQCMGEVVMETVQMQEVT